MLEKKLSAYEKFMEWLYFYYPQNEMFSDFDRANYVSDEYKENYNNFWESWFKKGESFNYSELEDYDLGFDNYLFTAYRMNIINKEETLELVSEFFGDVFEEDELNEFFSR